VIGCASGTSAKFTARVVSIRPTIPISDVYRTVRPPCSGDGNPGNGCSRSNHERQFTHRVAPRSKEHIIAQINAPLYGEPISPGSCASKAHVWHLSIGRPRAGRRPSPIPPPVCISLGPGHHTIGLPGHSPHRFYEPPKCDGLFRASAVPIVPIPLALGSTAASAVHPTNPKATHRRSLAPLSGPL
jgi:hypothetical protein